MIRLPGHSRKLDVFHRSLIDSGRIRLFGGTLEQWTYPPLLEKDRIAALVRRRYEAHSAAVPRNRAQGLSDPADHL
jgi:uncharacterized protein